MPSLVDVLRERFVAQQDALRTLQEAIVANGGDSTDEQDAMMRDLNAEIATLTPRLEQAVTVDRQASAAAQLLARAPAPSSPATTGAAVENLYRSAGEYLCDYIAARQNNREATDRLAAYHARTPQNQLIADNPGIVPEPIVGGVLQWIDQQRPLVEMVGVRSLPAYPTFYRPHIIDEVTECGSG